MIHRVLHFVRLRGPLADDPTAGMLHALLLAVALWMGLGWMLTLHLAPITFFRVFNIAVLEASLLLALMLLRRGGFISASLIYLAGIWTWATLAVMFNGGIRSPVLVLYVTLPISAAWLLGYRASLWTAAACVATALAFVFLEIGGHTPPRYIQGTAFGLWAVFVQATLIGTIPVGHVIRRLLDTLKELEEYRLRLESLVDKRTVELVEARDQAQAANRAKSVFLANMSHELRTPLNAILGFSNLLREHGATEEQRRDLDIINRSGEHLLGLINDVLDVAKIEVGGKQLEIAPCDLGALIFDVKEMIRAQAEKKGLELRVEAPASPLNVRTDAARLRQVLLNLLNNAIKFTEQGSVVLRLRTTPADDPPRVLLHFEIEDTGCGIAPKDRALIFDAFVQASASRGQQGSGLGLTISRQIVHMMGGAIGVESRPGPGSLFRVEIPVERAEESEVERETESDRITALEEGQPECRVLIVEDQQENWMVLERLLTNAGFRVRVAENGAHGVREFQEWRPQFVWMDMRMPVMDGLEATRRIRACEGGREAKIAAVTASSCGNQQDELHAAGVDDYVRKPFRPAEIFECMARHLAVRYRSRDATATSQPRAPRELTSRDMAALPDELRGELQDAVSALDTVRISAAIERISRENAALGAILSHFADEYAYTAIFTAIKEVDRDRAGV